MQGNVFYTIPRIQILIFLGCRFLCYVFSRWRWEELLLLFLALDCRYFLWRCPIVQQKSKCSYICFAQSCCLQSPWLRSSSSLSVVLSLSSIKMFVYEILTLWLVELFTLSLLYNWLYWKLTLRNFNSFEFWESWTGLFSFLLSVRVFCPTDEICYFSWLRDDYYFGAK